MGKRGPKVKTEYPGVSRVHSIRLRSDLHAFLSDAAKRRGKSLSDEIQNRLRRTLFEEEKIADQFGDRQTFFLMRMIALAIQQMWNPDLPSASWLDDPFAFDQALKTANNVLAAIRPPGAIEKQSDPILDVAAQIRPNQSAAMLWKSVQDADPALPLHEGSRVEHLLGTIKAELGDVVRRPRIFAGNSDDFARYAEELRAEENKQAAEKSGHSRRRTKADKGRKR
jgi:hypothetical protein